MWPCSIPQTDIKQALWLADSPCSYGAYAIQPSSNDKILLGTESDPQNASLRQQSWTSVSEPTHTRVRLKCDCIEKQSLSIGAKWKRIRRLARRGRVKFISIRIQTNFGLNTRAYQTQIALNTNLSRARRIGAPRIARYADTLHSTVFSIYRPHIFSSIPME